MRQLCRMSECQDPSASSPVFIPGKQVIVTYWAFLLLLATFQLGWVVASHQGHRGGRDYDRDLDSGDPEAKASANAPTRRVGVLTVTLKNQARSVLENARVSPAALFGQPPPIFELGSACVCDPPPPRTHPPALSSALEASWLRQALSGFPAPLDPRLHCRPIFCILPFSSQFLQLRAETQRGVMAGHSHSFV